MLRDTLGPHFFLQVCLSGSFPSVSNQEAIVQHKPDTQSLNWKRNLYENRYWRFILGSFKQIAKAFLCVNGQKGSISTSVNEHRRLCLKLLRVSAIYCFKVLTQLRTHMVKLNTVLLPDSCTAQEILFLTFQFLLNEKVGQTKKLQVGKSLLKCIF